MNKKIGQLKKEFLSQDFDIREKEIEKLVKIKDDSVVEFFIKKLKSKDRKVQSSSAVALRSIADNRAIKPLLEAIKNPANRNYTGSFVYALQTLDCSKLLPTLILLALYGSYEVQNHALTIITEQSFKTTKKEINILRQMIKKYLKNKNKCEDYEILVNDLERHLLRIEDEIKKQ